MARIHVSTTPPPSSPSPRTPLEELISCAAERVASITALEQYRNLWNARYTTSIPFPITHDLPPKTTADLIRHFNAICLAHNDRNVSSNITWLLSDECPWHQDFGGVLGIYVLFGERGVTRRFLKELRDLAGLRTPKGDPLPLARAVELLERARTLRRNKSRAGLRTTSRTHEWQPWDCKTASQLAMNEDGMHWPAESTRQKEKCGVQSQQPESAEQDSGHEGDRQDNSGQEGDRQDSGQEHDGQVMGQEVDGQNRKDMQHVGQDGNGRRHEEEEDTLGQSRSSLASAATPERGRHDGSNRLFDHSSPICDPGDLFPFPSPGLGAGPSDWAAQLQDDDAETNFINPETFPSRPQHSTTTDSSGHYSISSRSNSPLIRPAQYPADMALLSKRLHPRSEDGDREGIFVSSTARFWEQNNTTLQRAKIARDVIATFCHPRDELMESDAVGTLLEQSIVVKHNALDGSTYFTTLSSVASSSVSAVRFWFVAEVDPAEHEAIVYTTAPTEASSGIAGMLQQLHPGDELQTRCADLPKMSDQGEYAGFVSCLALATTLVAACKPPPKFSAPIWTSAVQACQVPASDRRTSKLHQNPNLLPDDKPARSHQRRKLDMLSNSAATREEYAFHREENALQHAIDVYRQKVNELSERLVCLEEYTSQIKHIRLCADTVSSHAGTESTQYLETQITQARVRMEMAKTGSSQHDSAKETLRSLEAELQTLRTAQPASNLCYVKTWADTMTVACGRELDTARQSREGALQKLRTIVGDLNSWMNNFH